MSKRNRWMVAVLFLANIFGLFVSYEVKEPCLSHPWGGDQKIEYRKFCYNDLQALYNHRHLNERRLPYIEERVFEYPPVIGAEMWLASLFSTNHVEFFKVNFVFLSLASLLTVLGLIWAVGPTYRVLWFAVGTPLIFYAFLNWDILAVAPLALAMGFHKRKKTLACGVSLGVGAAAKLFPGFAWVPVAVAFLGSRDRQEGKHQIKMLGIGACLGWGIFNIPIMIASLVKFGDFSAWLGMFQFHANRLPDFGTAWHWLPQLSNQQYWLVLAILVAVPAVWVLISKDIRVGQQLVRPDRALWIWFLFWAGLLSVIHVTTAFRDGAVSWTYKDLVDKVSFFTFAGFYLLFTWMGWKQKKDPWGVSAAIVCVFLLVSKVHSPQYALWLLPFFVALRTPPVLVVAYFLADAAVFFGGFWWIADGMKTDPFQRVFIAGVFGRCFLLMILAYWYLFFGSTKDGARSLQTG